MAKVKKMMSSRKVFHRFMMKRKMNVLQKHGLSFKITIDHLPLPNAEQHTTKSIFLIRQKSESDPQELRDSQFSVKARSLWL